MNANTRPLLLYSLVSKNVFDGSSKVDFFTSLLPFFEPFLSSRNGKILSLEELLSYSRDELMLPISLEVGEIFVTKMAAQGWLRREQENSGQTIYSIQHRSRDEIDSRFKDIQRDFDTLYQSVRVFSEARYPDRAFPSPKVFEEELLIFLLENFTSQSAQNAEDTSAKQNGSSLSFVLAKFIETNKEEFGSELELIERLTGVALVAETIIELRAPTVLAGKSKTGLIAYIDAPLIMAQLGLSGKAAKEDAIFLSERMLDTNISTECLREACDEIRDNLLAMLDNPPHLRTGPTADAIRRNEISEMQCRAIANDPAHYIKAVTKISVRSISLLDNDPSSKFFPRDAFYDVADVMPSTNFRARERDAASIGAVMRRRGGHETRNFFECKAIFVTSNIAVVAATTRVLRDQELISEDRQLIGPAVTNRTIAGLMFANAGAAAREKISRRQLLGACARVIMLRPRLVDQVRDQFNQLSKLDDQRMLDAILTQPRGADVFMDVVVGRGKTISPENHDELLEFMKRGLFEKELVTISNEKKAQEIHVNSLLAEIERTRQTITETMSRKNDETTILSARIDQMQKQAAEHEQQARESRERELQRNADLQDKLQTVADQVAQKASRQVVWQVRLGLAVSAALFFTLLIASSSNSDNAVLNSFYKIACVVAAGLNVFSFAVWLLDIKPKWYVSWVKKGTLNTLRQQLASVGLLDHLHAYELEIVDGYPSVTRKHLPDPARVARMSKTKNCSPD